MVQLWPREEGPAIGVTRRFVQSRRHQAAAESEIEEDFLPEPSHRRLTSQFEGHTKELGMIRSTVLPR